MAGASIYREALGEIELGVRSSEEQDEIRKKLDVVVDQAVKFAKDIAPVGQSVDHDAAPGTFRDSIVGKDMPDVDGMPAAQIYSEAVNPAGHKYSIFVEFGSRGRRGHGTFASTRKYVQRMVRESGG
jgi:hypothetical protein